MASIELRETVVDAPAGADQAPPIYRQSGSLRVSGGGGPARSGVYKSVAFVDGVEKPDGPILDATCLELALKFFLSNKLNLLLGFHLVLLLAVLSTLSIVAALAHGRGFAAPQIICGGAGGNETCTITTNILPPLSPVDPDDLDAVALHELTRRELFRVIKKAVKDVFLNPQGNSTSFLQLLAHDLTAQLEALQHPESGK